MSNDTKIRTRFAPSPTGFVHVGSLRSALFNWLFARSHGGEVIFRVEDTDRERFVEGATDDLLKQFSWMGIDFDNADDLVHQSERLDIYKEHADILLKKDAAYWCNCSKERLDEVRKEKQKKGQPPMYDRYCRDKKLEYSDGCVLRLKVPQEKLQDTRNKLQKNIKPQIPNSKQIPNKKFQTVFTDMIKGEVVVENKQIDDQVLLKSDGFPTYHLAVVVDDYLMKISHVIRGDEWLISTPKHVLLYNAFGWELPTFAHIPLILAPDKSKLSKRHGSVSISEFQKEGYLPDALFNFVALLGWHPEGDDEIMPRDEIVERFSMERVQKSPAIFDREKMLWMDGEYIRQLDPDTFYDYSLSFLESKNLIQKISDFKFQISNFGEVDEKYLKKILSLEQTRVQILSEVGEGVGFFFNDNLSYSADDLVWKKSDKETTKKILTELTHYFENYAGEWSVETLETNVKQFIAENDYDNGSVLWPMRYALTGEKRSPSPFECAWVLGKNKTIERLQISVNML